MTDRRLKILLHESIIVGDRLERNLEMFARREENVKRLVERLDTLNGEMKVISESIESVGERGVTKIQATIEKSFDNIDMDTSKIADVLERHNEKLMKEADEIARNTRQISETLKKNGEAIVSSAQILRRSKIGAMWSLTMFAIGTMTGAAFLSTYPTEVISKIYHDKLKKIEKIEKSYERSYHGLKYLMKNGIEPKIMETSDDWDETSMRNAPMMLIPNDRIFRIDRVGNYRRIVMKRKEEP